ncbi:acyltransferase family protein [uncultured Shewanella sp.]|uniref:acyltransferase family protein n=1 Tax=uncultured Shewanella sp. TaxID=173975 RepID=UPI002630490D|nr:acyltransferase family protein [uncultured Shewanella sp.]
MNFKDSTYVNNFAINIFSKRNGNILKGIAIILMYFHHLFAFPERIVEPNYFIAISNNIDFEYYIAIFGKICVSMFLFLSGVGFSFSRERKLRYYLDKALGFYRAYIIVFLIFIPFGFLYFGNVNGVGFEIKTFFENLLMIESSYNGEWWFSGVYFLCVIFTPFYIRIGCLKSIVLSFSFLNVYFLLHMLSFDIGVLLNNFLLWQVSFISGLFYYNVISYLKLNTIIFRLKKYSFVLIVILLPLILISYLYLKVYALIFFTPVICLALCMAFNEMSNGVSFSLEWLGKKTLFMWLTHSFFCYYYFQSIVFAPKYSFLVFLNLILLTVPCCLVLEKLYEISMKLRVNKLYRQTG